MIKGIKLYTKVVVCLENYFDMEASSLKIFLDQVENRVHHRWELPGNYPVFTVVMAIYHYVERIWRILVTPIFYITYMIINRYYADEPVNIHIQSLINIIQEKNWVITTK